MTMTKRKEQAHRLRCLSEDAQQEAVFWRLAGDPSLAESRRLDAARLEWQAGLAERGDRRQAKLWEEDRR